MWASPMLLTMRVGHTNLDSIENWCELERDDIDDFGLVWTRDASLLFINPCSYANRIWVYGAWKRGLKLVVLSHVDGLDYVEMITTLP